MLALARAPVCFWVRMNLTSASSLTSYNEPPIWTSASRTNDIVEIRMTIIMIAEMTLASLLYDGSSHVWYTLLRRVSGFFGLDESVGESGLEPSSGWTLWSLATPELEASTPAILSGV